MTLPDDLISTQEAARILGITRAGVNWLIEQGRLEAQAMEGPKRKRWVLRRADVEAYRRRREGEG